MDATQTYRTAQHDLAQGAVLKTGFDGLMTVLAAFQIVVGAVVTALLIAVPQVVDAVASAAVTVQGSSAPTSSQPTLLQIYPRLFTDGLGGFPYILIMPPLPEDL